MPDKYSESSRFLFINSPLGQDVLLLESFTGQEGISQLFSFQLELLSEDKAIAFDAILGQKVSFGVNDIDGERGRHVHGIVSSFSQLPSNLRLGRYRAEVVPQLWLFTRRARSRIFQGKDVQEILKLVLAGLDVSYELTGSFPKRDYCVQYRETDFAFASRLMEEEGIFYYFKHSVSTHKLVIANAAAAHTDILGVTRIIFDEVSGGNREEQRISDWLKTQEIGSGKHTLWDYDYLAPSTRVQSESTVLPTVQVGKVAHKLKVSANSDLEVYDYPAGIARFHQNDHSSLSGEMAAVVRTGMQEMDRSQFTIRGCSNVNRFTPGHKFTLDEHPNADGAYVLTRVVHSAHEGDFYSAGPTDSSQYSNTFECLPLALPYRPAHETEKPHVWGCQTAVVVGPSGEEIFVDKHSRVKIQFHWDRDGTKDANSSCWVRVASFWAGKQWGAIHIPRIGQEVIVDFLEGDPDQPIIVGSVYNADNMPPYSLPDNKTQSGIKSRSSQGGGAANYNEIRFEDKKGSEEILIHAELDMKTEVERDEVHNVDRDRTTKIGRDEKVDVGKDRTTTVTGNDKETIQQKQTIMVMSDQETTVMGGMKTTVTGQKTETVASSRSATIAASDSLTAVGGLSISTPATVTISAAGGVTITASMITLNAPMVSVTGVVQCMTLIASVGVVSPVYTPGAGNMI